MAGMAEETIHMPVPLSPEGDSGTIAALQHDLWRRRWRLSSVADICERFLASAGFERAPWLAVAFAGGIALWFGVANMWQWLAALSLLLAVLLSSLGLLSGEGRWPWLRIALASLALMLAAGMATVWTKSALVGTPAIEKPVVTVLEGRIISREEQPAEERVRLHLETREPASGRAIRVRVNLPMKLDRPGLVAGADVRMRARLMPPAPPMLPGGYDFARAAWFQGLAATGSVLGNVEVSGSGGSPGLLERWQARLSRHVRRELSGSSGAIAAALASGDRGAIAKADDDAMRDAGLTHLLSISGLHVSAVVAAAYVLAIRLLALWPWLALRVRLPLLAAGLGAATGIFYTLLTGAEVPTVRSCIGALLVLIALALGREPLSLRMLAVAALFVMLLWPEAVMGPSFQMSFSAVIAIVALHGCAPVRAFLAPREESWAARLLRRLAMLLLAGVVIELALMPIGLFHFHRAGVYGALANVVAIPLTTFVTMPLIAVALLLDSVGAGAPAWWLVGKSLDAILALAHFTAAQPGSVTMMPTMSRGSIMLFVVGGLWLALWRGRVRLLGMVPVLLGCLTLLALRPPDVLVSSDGRHLGITGEPGAELLVLREGKSSFARDNLVEHAGMNGEVKLLAEWPGVRCSPDFCALELVRGGREWRLLIGRSRDRVPVRALAAACERVDIVISDRWLSGACRRRHLKADRGMLGLNGGLAIDLSGAVPSVRTVAQGQGTHGWWRPEKPKVWPKRGLERRALHLIHPDCHRKRLGKEPCAGRAGGPFQQGNAVRGASCGNPKGGPLFGPSQRSQELLASVTICSHSSLLSPRAGPKSAPSGWVRYSARRSRP